MIVAQKRCVPAAIWQKKHIRIDIASAAGTHHLSILGLYAPINRAVKRYEPLNIELIVIDLLRVSTGSGAG